MPAAKRAALPSGRMTITMLGVSKAGKSTYILGMYAELVQGVNGCFLHLPDPDAGARLFAQLERLRSGQLPEATEEPIPHEFSLTFSGSSEWATMDLADFRGGAPFEETHGKATDTAKLYQRLLTTDSIFVFLDAEHFREPVSPSRLQAVRQATGGDHFSNMISLALAERQRSGHFPPSVVVVLTKADLIDGRPGSVARKWPEVQGEIRQVVGAAFQPHLAAQIFATSVVSYEASANDRASVMSVQPCEPAYPVIFAVGCFLAERRVAVQQQRDQAQLAYQEVKQRRDKLAGLPRVIQWLLSTRTVRVTMQANELMANLDRLDEQLTELARRSQALLGMFDFVGGG